MPRICIDENNFFFPPIKEADEEGLLLIGGKVTPQRIIEAYKKGIFPWYNDDSLPMWFSPDPRFVLFPDELHISRSMQRIISKNIFEFKTNTSFEKVIQKCATVNRKGQEGTWITGDIKNAYTKLFYDGYAHCGEAWKDGLLVGGIYGIRIGKVFFGESMFSLQPNASKFAFIHFVKYLQQNAVNLFDCQVYTTHVESLGGRLISRDEYILLLQNLVSR